MLDMASLVAEANARMRAETEMAELRRNVDELRRTVREAIEHGTGARASVRDLTPQASREESEFRRLQIDVEVLAKRLSEIWPPKRRQTQQTDQTGMTLVWRVVPDSVPGPNEPDIYQLAWVNDPVSPDETQTDELFRTVVVQMLSSAECMDTSPPTIEEKFRFLALFDYGPEF